MQIYKNQGTLYESYIRPFYLNVAKTIGNMYMEMAKLELAFDFLNNFLQNQYSFDKTLNNEDKNDTKCLAIIYHNLAVLSERKSDYEQALLFYFKSLERKRLLYKKPKDRKDKLCTTIIYMANVYEQLNDDTMALQLYKEAIALYELATNTTTTSSDNKKGSNSNNKNDYNTYAQVYTSISYIHAKNNEVNDAIEYMKQKIKLAHKCTNSNILHSDLLDYDCKKDLADGYHTIGLLYTYNNNTKEYDESIESYNKSYEIKKVLLEQYNQQHNHQNQRHGQHHKSSSTLTTLRKSIFYTLKNLSNIYNITNQQDNALQSYQDSLNHVDNNDNDDEISDLCKIKIFNDIGVLLCKNNKYYNAKEYYDKALQYECSLTYGCGKGSTSNSIVLSSIDKDKNLKQKLHIAILNNAGNSLIEINHSNNNENSKKNAVTTAMGYYSTAADIWSSNQYLRNMSSTLSTSPAPSNYIIYNVGLVRMKQYDYTAAITSFMKYLKIKGHDTDDFLSNIKTQNNDDDDKSTTHIISNKKSLDETSTALNCIGNAYYYQGYYEDSVIYFQKALTIKKSIYDESSYEIVSILCNLGTSYYQSKQYDLAYENIQSAYTIYRNHLAIASYAYDDKLQHLSAKKVTTLLNKIGNIQAKQKKYDDALKSYEQAYDTQKESLLGVTNHPDILCIQHNIALLHARGGNLDEALAQLQSIKSEYENYYNHQQQKLSDNSSNTSDGEHQQQERNNGYQQSQYDYDITMIKLNLDTSGVYLHQKNVYFKVKEYLGNL